MPTGFDGAQIDKLCPTMFLASLIGLPWPLRLLPADLFWPVAQANRFFLLNGPAWRIFLKLIAGGLQIERPGRLLVLAGAISFPLYAVHGPVLRTVRMLGINPWLGAAASIALAWGLVKILPIAVAAAKRAAAQLAPKRQSA